MYDIKGYSFNTLVNRLSKRLNVTSAAAFNLINGESDNDIAEKFGVVPAALDCIYSGEAHKDIADKLGLTYSELNNLIKLHEKKFSIGLLIGFLLK